MLATAFVLPASVHAQSSQAAEIGRAEALARLGIKLNGGKSSI